MFGSSTVLETDGWIFFLEGQESGVPISEISELGSLTRKKKPRNLYNL
jgi:hypothetical protein